MKLMHQLASIIPFSRRTSVTEFRHRVGWAKSYDALFREEWDAESQDVGVIDRAEQRGRVMLCGRGGSGKTTILLGVHDKLRSSGKLSAFIRVSSIGLCTQHETSSGLASPVDALPFLLSHSDYDGGAQRFILSPEQSKFLIVDGLNEVQASVAEKIVQACDYIAAVYTGISVLISDRLVRRSLDERRWALGFVQLLAESEIVRTLRQSSFTSDSEVSELAKNPILRLPFFLEKALEKNLAENGETIIDTYLRDHGGVSAEQLPTLRKAAFELYRANRSRSFSLADLERFAGKELTHDLLASGAVERNGPVAQFSHHLVHDYLAADFVAEHEELWEADTLDILSFKGASFDAIAAVVERLDSAAGAKFLRRIYDWNLYAAGYALAEVSERQPEKIPAKIAEIVCAMLGEKRFDLFAPTSRKAEDALLLIRLPLAKRYAEADGTDEVYRIASEYENGDADFQSWLKLFTLPAGKPATDSELRLLSDVDSVLGWTSANVLKRLRLDEDQQKLVRSHLDASNLAAVRWRSAHVLGSFANDANHGALRSHLANKNEDLWVRYGSLRSMVEQAVHSDADLRQRIFSDLRNLWEVIDSEPKLKDELLNSLQIKSEMRPPEWSKLALNLVRMALADDHTETEEERIRKVAIAISS